MISIAVITFAVYLRAIAAMKKFEDDNHCNYSEICNYKSICIKCWHLRTSFFSKVKKGSAPFGTEPGRDYPKMLKRI